MENKDTISYYFKSCFSYIINHFVWYALTTIGLWIVTNAKNIWETFNSTMVNFSISFAIKTFIYLVLIMCVITYIIVYCKNKSRDKEKNKRKSGKKGDPLLNDITFEKVKIDMIIHSAKDIEYIMHMEGYANRNDLDSFSKHLTWTGDKYIGTRLEFINIGGFLDDNVDHRTHSPYSFTINFTDRISKGDRIKFVTKTQVSDENREMKPFSSFCIKYPIKQLILNLNVPQGMVRNVKKSGCRDLSGEGVIFSTDVSRTCLVDGSVLYSATFENPQPWAYYRLDWIFNNY